jgi:hypothetical protein
MRTVSPSALASLSRRTRVWLAVTADMPQFCAWFGYASGYRRASERLRR